MRISRNTTVAQITGLCLLLLGMGATSLQAGNWPEWRGPQRNGISNESNVPTTWSRTKNVAWRLELPGPAGATPVVWDDRIFLSTTDGDELVLMCISTDGKPLWRRTVGTGNKNVRRDEGNSASPSPVTDGEHVWVLMTTGDLACFDIDGHEVWKFNLQDRYGKFVIQFGMTSTPLLYKDRLYLQMIHGSRTEEDKLAVVAAIDKRTGEGIWKQHRATDAYDECKQSYASPILYQDKKRTFLITHGADYTIAHRLSDGSEIWRSGGLNPHDDRRTDYHPTLRFVASPAAAPGIVVIPTAKNGPVVAIRPNFEGNITKKKSAHRWRRGRNTPDVPTPLIHNGLVYLCRENGNLICLEAKTGRQLYHERTTRDRHRASPVYAAGHIYLTARKGIVSVVTAGRNFQLVSRNDLGEPITASPIVSNGTLYLRSFEALWAIRNE